MSQQSVRQAARRSALNAEAVLRNQSADWERRLEGLAVEVLTAIGERDGAVRDAERRRRSAADNDGRRGSVGPRGRRLVRGRRHSARGCPPASTRARSAGRRESLSVRQVNAAGLSALHRGGLGSPLGWPVLVRPGRMVIAHRFPFHVACGVDALDQVTMPGHPATARVSDLGWWHGRPRRTGASMRSGGYSPSADPRRAGEAGVARGNGPKSAQPGSD
jgi:hypothetical protein